MELTTIELFREEMKFNAGHFTIFSATEREALHGHQFTVGVSITAEVGEGGIAFDYGVYKTKIISLCSQLNEIFLIAGDSPYLAIERDEEFIYLLFNGERIPFLEKDVLIMPLRNITVEELSRWFLLQLTSSEEELINFRIHEIVVKVYSCPGQSGSCRWRRG